MELGLYPVYANKTTVEEKGLLMICKKLSLARMFVFLLFFSNKQKINPQDQKFQSNHSMHGGKQTLHKLAMSFFFFSNQEEFLI